MFCRLGGLCFSSLGAVPYATLKTGPKWLTGCAPAAWPQARPWTALARAPWSRRQPHPTQPPSCCPQPGGRALRRALPAHGEPEEQPGRRLVPWERGEPLVRAERPALWPLVPLSSWCGARQFGHGTAPGRGFQDMGQLYPPASNSENNLLTHCMCRNAVCPACFQNPQLRSTQR